MNPETLLQRRRMAVRMDTSEVLLMLRAYQQHPTRWKDIIDEIKQNLEQLPQAAKQLYRTASYRQLKDRLSSKLARLMAANTTQDADISAEVERIRDLERRNVAPHNIVEAPVLDEVQEPRHEPPVPAPAVVDPNTGDVRDILSEALPDSSDDDIRLEPPRRRRRLADLIRENHELYNDFMKNKLPRLMRDFGYDSDY